MWKDELKAAMKRGMEIPLGDHHVELRAHLASGPIVEALERVGPLSGGAFMLNSDNGSTGFGPRIVGEKLAKRIIDGGSIDGAIDWLERILATPHARGIGVLALWGVEVAAPCELAHGVTILPFEQLPNGRAKERMLRWDDRSFREPPSAALTTAAEIRPLWTPSGQVRDPHDPFALKSKLQDSCLALSIVGPCCPIPAAYWFEFDNREINDAALGTSYSISRDNSYWEVHPTRLDVAKAKSTVEAFLDLGEPLRSKIRLALGRFNQALRRPPFGDRALDLAIAIESLLVDKGSEINYKIALRAALLLGGNLEARLKTRDIVKALYGLRSDLVHNGLLPEKARMDGAKRHSVEVVDAASIVCAKVIEAVMLQGSVDWERLELGSLALP